VLKILNAWAAASAVAVALIVGNGDVAAQEARTNDRDATAAQNVRNTADRFDYGILGLGGLLGLLGLMPRDRRGGNGIAVRDGDLNVKDSARR
jgi:CheY-like chemotaxis protein